MPDVKIREQFPTTIRLGGGKRAVFGLGAKRRLNLFRSEVFRVDAAGDHDNLPMHLLVIRRQIRVLERPQR